MQHLSAGEGSVAFPLAYRVLGLQTGNTLAPDSRGLLAFSIWIMRLEVLDLLQDGGSWFVCVVGQLPGQAAGGLWEQLDEEV